MIQLMLTTLIIALVIFMLIKKYQPHAVLIFAGILLLIIANFIGEKAILPEGKSTGWFGFDIFEFLSQIMISRVGGIGLIIMSAGGFAKYMNHIGAANALVQLAVKPLKRLKNPYLILFFVSIIGQVLKVGIPSAAGLAMLLLITVYPILIRLGITPASAAAVIAGTTCLDLGPASATTNVAADLIGMDVVLFFVKMQIPAIIIPIFAIALLNYFVQQYFDKREGYEPGKDASAAEVTEHSHPKVPTIFAILPLIPLILLLIFSKLVVGSIILNVVTAMVISLFIGIFAQLIYTKNLHESLHGIMIYFKGMGSIFATIVTLIFAAETFAGGLKAVGFIDMLLGLTDGQGVPSSVLMLLLVAIIGVTAILTGSGNAAFFSFGNLAPGFASGAKITTAALILPMQLVSGLFRTISPVAGVIIAVSGTAEIDPFIIVKRTAIPMVGAILAVIGYSWLVF